MRTGSPSLPCGMGNTTYQEYNAPEGYEIDESEYAFEIKEDGQIVKATMTNEKIPEELITTPRPGMTAGRAGGSDYLLCPVRE